MESMDKGDNPLYHILGPIISMTAATVDMTSNPENCRLFLQNDKSNAILVSLQRFNTEIMDILDEKQSTSNGQTQNNSLSKPPPDPVQEEELMPLPNIIALLADPQQEYDEQQLLDSLQQSGITRSNFDAVTHRQPMLSILKKCGFAHKSALNLIKEIETNFAPQTHLSNGRGHGPSYRSDPVSIEPEPELKEEDPLYQPVNLTIMAMETILSDNHSSKIIDRGQVIRIYRSMYMLFVLFVFVYFVQ